MKKAHDGYNQNRAERKEYERALRTEVPAFSSTDKPVPEVPVGDDFEGRGVFRFTAEDPLLAEGLLGRGTYGEVFACRFQSLKLALKVAVRTPDKDTAVLDVHKDGLEKTWDLTREYTVISQVGPHPNVLQLYSLVTSSTSHTGILMERASCDLFKVVRELKTEDKDDGVPWTTRRTQLTSYFRQTLVGLTYVHGKNIVHLDVKTNNFLVFLPEERVVLSDFGFCRALPIGGKCRVRADEVYAAYYRPIELLYSGAAKARRSVWHLQSQFVTAFCCCCFLK